MVNESFRYACPMVIGLTSERPRPNMPLHLTAGR